MVVRCAVGEGKRWSAPRSIFTFDLRPQDCVKGCTLRAGGGCYNRFRVLRVVVLRVVASSLDEYAGLPSVVKKKSEQAIMTKRDFCMFTWCATLFWEHVLGSSG